MRTQVRESSIAAYRDLSDSGKIGAQAQTILNHMKAGRDYSLQELSRLTGIAINAISGRCNDLKKIGLLVEAACRKCSITGRTVHPVCLPTAQGELIL